ncbi:pilin [Nonomuraea harbinensis]|uniref:Pilin n=1 Tax=Nonomuraea harbinensis TaxID=1286938 RepID=A0ABW1BN25_9ACTN|nr:pilin [Nonomuraea harbinensis]
MDTAETSFRLLTTGPGGLSLNCAAITPELPRGSVGLRELRTLLTSRHVSDAARDAVWRELVARARQGKSAWTVAAVGMAMPALRTIALSLTRTLPAGDPVDVDIAILAGFLRGVHRVDVDLPGIRPRLCEAARFAGERTVRYLVAKAERQRGEPPPPRPWFHPDLVLIDAVSEGVLDELDAELIALSRLEDVPLRTPVPPTFSSAACSSTGVDEQAHMTSARNQGTPDATTATDPKGGRGTTPGSARISPNHPSVAARARRARRRRPARCRPRRRTPLPCWVVTWVLAVTAAAVLVIAAAATGACAASVVAAVPKDLNSVLTNLRNWLIGLLAALSTLMLTIGGLRYLVAGGDPSEVQKAKGALKAAAFGYALAVLAPLFVSVLKRIVGG